MDPFPLLSNMGLDGAWLPILVALLAVPTQYVLLGMSAHQEFREVAAALADKDETSGARGQKYLESEASSNLRVFELDWWIVGAFGILVTIIIASGYLSGWAKTSSTQPTAVVDTYRCVLAAVQKLSCTVAPNDAGSAIKNVMSLYATLVSLLIGFRLGWARLQLAKELSQYYVVGGDKDASAVRDKTMPPSGYDTKQAGYLRDFLRSCAAALLAEARVKQISFVEALASEIRDIDGHLKSGSSSDSQKATLEMTRAFYRKVLAEAPSDESAFEKAVQSASEDVFAEVVSVKVIAQAAE